MIRKHASKKSRLWTLILPASLFLVLFAAACSTDNPSSPDPDPDPDVNNNIVAGIDFNVVFAPATASEISAVQSDWAARNPVAENVVVEQTDTLFIDGDSVQSRVLSHAVNGFKHYTVVLRPFDAAAQSLPVMMYLHGGNSGMSLGELESLFGLLYRGLTQTNVIVAPVFRSEQLTAKARIYQAGGTESPWDFDVDDAIAGLSAALPITPEADATKIQAFGLSRGALVSLLQSLRDPRIKRICAFFGPTDFFDVFVQDIARRALQDTTVEVAGFRYMNETFIQPLRRGEISIQDMRMELVRRSGVLWASDLPKLQWHHGDNDSLVAVSQANSLIDAMMTIGRGAPEFEAFIYPGGQHNPLSMFGSTARALDFLLAPF